MDVQTRSGSALGEYPQLNNQRQPLIGEELRVRLPVDRKLQNIQSHGWIVIKSDFSHASQPKDEHGEDYIIKGTVYNSDKIVLLCLAMRGYEDDLDSRAKQGWDIVDLGEDPIMGIKHSARMTHSQHPDSIAVAQRIITEEEFQQYASEALNINAPLTEGNINETPRTATRSDPDLGSPHARLNPQRCTPVTDKTVTHSSNSEVTRPESSAPSSIIKLRSYQSYLDFHLLAIVTKC